MLKHYESGQSKLYLSSTSFFDQPQCWQNMVRHLNRTDPEGMEINYFMTVAKHLELYNLSLDSKDIFVLDHKVGDSVKSVMGAHEDLMAWMLAYA